jgi:hypothetical protein
MKTKFTQGEWTVEEEKNSISAWFEIRGKLDAVFIAETPSHVINGRESNKTEKIANAKLIAAAPDLLNALENLHEWVIRTHVGLNDLSELKAATAAIKKATE